MNGTRTRDVKDAPMRNETSTQQANYEIQVEGYLDERWGTWFSGLTVTLQHVDQQPPITTLTGPVADQSALRGLLGKLWDLNLTILSVQRIETEKDDGRSWI